MNPDEILEAAARAMADGIDPAKVDAAVRKRTGMGLQELGAQVGRERFPETQPKEPRGMDPRSVVGHLAAQGATVGLSDELRGAGAALIPGGRGYAEGRDAEREALAQARSQAGPIGSIAAETAGGLVVPGAGAAKFIGKGLTVGGRMLRGAVAGSAAAGAYGAGTAEGGPAERLAGAARAAPVGAVVGGAIPAVGPVVRGVGRGVARNQGIIGRVARGVADEFRTPIGRAKAWVKERARQSGTQLSEAEITRLAESRLAELEGNLTRPLRPKPEPKAKRQRQPAERRPDTYQGLVDAQRKIEREINPQGAEAEELARAVSAQADAALQRTPKAPQSVSRTPRDLGLEPVVSATPEGRITGRPDDIRGISPNPQQHATRAQMEFRSAPIRERVTGLEEIQAVGLKAFQEGDQAMLDQVNQVLRERGMAFDWSTIAEDAAKQSRRQ